MKATVKKDVQLQFQKSVILEELYEDLAKNNERHVDRKDIKLNRRNKRFIKFR